MSFSQVITPLLAVFELVLFMIVPHDLPVHYYAFYAIHIMHFIITLVSLQCSFCMASRMSVIMRLQCIWICMIYIIHIYILCKTKTHTTEYIQLCESWFCHKYVVCQGDVEEDESVPDKESDIRPRFYRPRTRSIEHMGDDVSSFSRVSVSLIAVYTMSVMDGYFSKLLNYSS